MKVIVAGDEIELATTEAKPTIGIVDYSRRETDDFGVTTVVRRGFARRMSVRAKVPFSDVDALQSTLADLRAQPVKWVADERFASLAFDGFYKDFAIDLAVPPVSFCTLTVEGLTETEAGADPGGDPAADGNNSTLRLLQPALIDDGVLAAINVPEDDQPVWSAGITYPFGARVIRAHRQWESLVVANLGNEPAAGSAQWMDIGPTNRWAMFDDALGTLTEAAGSIIATLDPAAPIDGLALLDVTAATVRVQAAGYDRTIAPSAAGSAMFLDIPDIASAITVTVTGPGTVSVGTMMIGKLVGLGVTEASPSAGINDYSRKETDEFGDVTVVERAWAKRMDARALLRTDAVDLVFDRIATVRGRPCLWIGAEGVEALSIYGFFKDFSIEVDENVSTLALSIEGLSKAAQLAPLDSPPYLVTVFQNAADAPAPPPIDAGEVPPGWTLAPTELVEGQFRWSTQAKFLLGVQQTAWTQPVKVGGVSWQDVVDDDPERPKPEDGATVGATPEQAEAIGHHTEQIEAALEEIQGLIDTYGTTASAAASAAAAEAERIAAENAKVAAVDARDDASGFASAAEGSATIAHDAEVAAAASAGLAAGYQGQAEAFAENAEESAVVASDRAAAASESANLTATYSTGGGNQLVNTELAIDTRSWAFFHNGQGTVGVVGRNAMGDTWRLPNENNWGIQQLGTNSAFAAALYQDINGEPGKWYEASAWLASQNCQSMVEISFYDASFGPLPNGGITAYVTTSPGGQNIANWQRVAIKKQAPAGTCYVRIALYKLGTLTGTESYMWAMRPQIRETFATAPSPTLFSHGGNRSTLAVMQASVQTNADAIATANDAIASLTTRVKVGGRNMLKKKLNMGFDGWTIVGSGWFFYNDDLWGPRVVTPGAVGGYTYVISPVCEAIPGVGYTASCDASTSGSTGEVYVELQFLVGGSWVSIGAASKTSGGYSTDQRNRLRKSGVAPTGASLSRMVMVTFNKNGQSEFRQPQLEAGLEMTAYNEEAAVTETMAAATDAFGRTRAYMQVLAAVPGSRAQLTVWADNAGAGVDIVGNVAISGGLLVDGTINGVKLQDLAVQTAKIANYAVNVPVTAYTEAEITAGENVWLEVQSVTIGTTGALVDIISSGTLKFPSVSAGLGYARTQMRIKRNGTIIREQPEMLGVRITDITTYGSGTIAMTDNPIAGTYTYTVEVLAKNMSLAVRQRYLRAIEIKK